MELGLNAVVDCGGSRYGAVTRIIINPVTRAVVYLAVKQEKAPRDEVLVPIGMIASITAEHVPLLCANAEHSRFPRFIEQEFIKIEGPQGSMAGYLMLPYAVAKNLMIAIQHKRLSEDELVVRRGARIEAADGEVGRVEEFLIDSANGQITHLVMRQAHALGVKEICIPVDAIARMDENTIYLSLDKEGLERLPHIPVWRNFWQDWDGAQELVKSSIAATAHQLKDIEKLIASLASTSQQGRIQARKMLVALGKPAVPALSALADTARHQLCWEAAKTLAQINDPACVPGLLKAMEDERFDIRWVAADGLAALGLPAVKSLLELLQEKPDSTRLRESAHHVLRSLIQDEPWPEMRALVLALEKFGTEAASLPRAAQRAQQSLSAHTGQKKN